MKTYLLINPYKISFCVCLTGLLLLSSCGKPDYEKINKSAPFKLVKIAHWQHPKRNEEPCKLRRLTFSEDGNLLVSAAKYSKNPLSGFASVYDVSTKQLVFQDKAYITDVAIRSDNRYIYGSTGKRTTIWNIKNKRRRQFSEPTFTFNLAISPDNKHLAVGISWVQQQVLLRDALTMQSLQSLYKSKMMKFTPKRLCFSSDGQFLLAAGGKGGAKIWNLDSGWQKTIRSPENYRNKNNTSYKATVVEATFANREKLFATGSKSGKIHVWKLANKVKRIKTLKSQGNSLAGLAFQAGDRYLFTVNYKHLEVFDRTKPKRSLVYGLKSPGGSLTALALSKDGTLAATGDAEGNIYLWSIKK